MIREHLAHLGLPVVLLAAFLAALLLTESDDKPVTTVTKTAVRVSAAARKSFKEHRAEVQEAPVRRPEKQALPHDEVPDTCGQSQTARADTLSAVPADRAFTAATAATELGPVVLPPLPDSLYEAYVPAGTRPEWLLGMASAAGQTSGSLLSRVFSVVSNTTESGTRLDIETWQQLAHYLTYDVGDNIEPVRRDALLRIAMANKGRIHTRRSYDRPLQMGLNFSKRLSERWTLDFGLRFTRHTTWLQTGDNDTTNIREKQRSWFVGVPVNATYSLWNKGRWTLYGTAGMALDIPFHGRSETCYNIDNTVAYRRGERLELPRPQWSVNVGAGVSYDISRGLQLFVSPRLTWYVPNGSRTVTQWQDEPLQLSVPFGLRVVFK